MAILRLTLRQRYVNQLVLNTFDFVASGTPAAVSLSFALVAAFGAIPDPVTGYPLDSAFHAFRQPQVEGVLYEEAQAENLYSVTDFYTRPFLADTTGLYDDVGLSPFNAYGLYTNRVRTDVRRGMKRIAGVAEGANGEGGVLTSPFPGYLEDFCDILSAPLTYDDEGNTLTFTSCVLGLDMYTVPPAPKAYRPYGTEAGQLEHTAQGILWQAYPNVRSQVSRSVGRGA